MTFALDTDIFSLLVLGHARVTARHTEVIAAAEDEITIPAMVRMEVLEGRFEAVKKAADGAGLRTLYDRVVRTEAALGAYRILELTETVADHFDRFRMNKKLKKIGRPDLPIACIALAHNARLVTRNVKDFANLPGLRGENWAA